MLDFQNVLAGVSAFTGALVGVAGVAWWLRSQFSNVYDHVGDIKETLLTKMDAHEKMDIERFGKQDLALMRIELRQNGSTGKTVFEM